MYSTNTNKWVTEEFKSQVRMSKLSIYFFWFSIAHVDQSGLKPIEGLSQKCKDARTNQQRGPISSARGRVLPIGQDFQLMTDEERGRLPD